MLAIFALNVIASLAAALLGLVGGIDTWVGVVGLLPPLVANVIGSAAVMRAIASPDAQGAPLLRLGAGELRLLILHVLMWVIGFVGFLLFYVVPVWLVGGNAGDPDVLVVLALFGVAIVLTLALLTRFTLIGPILLAEGRWRPVHAWTLSGRLYWRLFGAVLIVGVVAALASFAALLVGSVAAGFLGYNIRFDRVWGRAVTLTEVFAPTRVLFWLLAGGVSAVLCLFWNGIGARAYRDLVGDPVETQAEVFS